MTITKLLDGQSCTLLLHLAEYRPSGVWLISCDIVIELSWCHNSYIIVHNNNYHVRICIEAILIYYVIKSILYCVTDDADVVHCLLSFILMSVYLSCLVPVYCIIIIDLPCWRTWTIMISIISCI